MGGAKTESLRINDIVELNGDARRGVLDFSVAL